MSDKKQEFKDEIVKTIELKKEEQVANDNDIASEIISGSSEIYINGLGTITFIWPSVGLSMQGDKLHAQFKAEHLRKGDLLSEAQLKAYYKRPVFIEIDGKEIQVGNGEWTEEEEEKLESLPLEIQELNEEFDMHRATLQEQQLEMDSLPKNSKKRTVYEKKIEEITEAAYNKYIELTKKRLEVGELNLKRNTLFSDSLEEMANLEKIRLFAPQCILKRVDGELVPLWESEDDMLKAQFASIRAISLFNLFMRGVDVSFFADTLGE